MALGALLVPRLTGHLIDRGTTTSADAGTPIAASAFAEGACVAFAPTQGATGRTVFLDAGHGGGDPGGVGALADGTPVTEASVNLPIAEDVMAELRTRGYRVVLSRTQDSSVARLTSADVIHGGLSLRGVHEDVAARDRCADAAHADVLVGIYMDAGPPSAAGSVTTYDTSRPFAAANTRLGRLLEHDTVTTMDRRGWAIPDNGAVTDTHQGSSSGDPATGGLAAQAAAYHHLLLLGPAAGTYFAAPSTMPGAVIEPLYLTDPFEAALAVSATDQGVIAGGIAQGIEQWFAGARL